MIVRLFFKMGVTLLLFLSSVILASCLGSNPIVKVTQGSVQGVWKQSTNERTYASFQGVPYALPPVGKYRFREPQHLKHWDGVWNASTPSAKCLQYSPFSQKITGSEDCLYVNVATPNPQANASLPVVIFIHGGAFMYGEGKSYSPVHLMDRDLVVVTFNYRLGPLGFLSTGDKAAPGNAGLKDQAFALKWVKKNIAVFGGNPDSITLTGESAGGASVYYHYLSPLSQGLFHRGISFSGSPLSSWTYATKPLQKAKTLASIVGCPLSNSHTMVKCLRNSSAEAIVNAQTEMFEWRIHLFTPFTPTMEPVCSNESAFLTQYPYEAIQNSEMAKVPFITTITSEEGLYPAARYQTNSTILPELESHWEQLASKIFKYNDTLPLDLQSTVAAQIKQHYFNGSAISQETFSELVQALGDRLFVVDAGKLAQLHADKSGQRTYLYRYAFHASVSISNALAGNNINYGVSHGDEGNLLFNFLPMVATAEDIKMRDAFVNLVYSYASTGIPQLSSSVQWDPVQPEATELNYLNILSGDSMAMQTNSDFGQRSFWDSLGFVENERYDVE